MGFFIRFNTFLMLKPRGHLGNSRVGASMARDIPTTGEERAVFPA